MNTIGIPATLAAEATATTTVEVNGVSVTVIGCDAADGGSYRLYKINRVYVGFNSDAWDYLVETLDVDMAEAAEILDTADEFLVR
jgi:hypothetical protein